MKRRGRIYILALLVFCLSSSCNNKNQNITGNSSHDTLTVSSNSSIIHSRNGYDTLSVDNDSLDAMIRTRDSLASEKRHDSIRIVHEKNHQQEPSGNNQKPNNQNDKKANDKGVKPSTRPSDKKTRSDDRKTVTRKPHGAPLGAGEGSEDGSGEGGYTPGPPQATPPIKYPLPNKPRPKGR